MNKLIFKNRFWAIVLVFCLIFSLSASNAFAWGGHGRGRYYWHEGRWYGPGWLGFDVAISALTAGAIIATLPRGYTTVVVAGAPYYYYDGYYFRNSPDGYIVVPAPAVVTVPNTIAVTQNPAPYGETVVINVPNSNGTYTAVTLVKRGNGYLGPQGEYYQGHPTVEQLRVLYGR